jgi:hypothetical protein
MLPAFKQVATCEYVQGNSILLWKDKWAANTLQATWQQLCSFAKNDSISLQTAVQTIDITELFHLPMSEETHGSAKPLSTML